MCSITFSKAPSKLIFLYKKLTSSKAEVNFYNYNYPAIDVTKFSTSWKYSSENEKFWAIGQQYVQAMIKRSSDGKTWYYANNPQPGFESYNVLNDSNQEYIFIGI